MRLPSSNIGRILAYAFGAGLGLGVVVYGFVRVVEQLPGASVERAALFALLVGALLGLALAMAARLALRQAAYDLHNHAVDLTDLQLPAPGFGSDDIAAMRHTLSQAVAGVPRSEAFPQLATDLAAAADADVALAAAAGQLASHVPLQGALLLLLDAERSLLYPAASYGQVVFEREMALDLYATAIGRALTERRPALYSGLEARNMLPVRSGREATSLFCEPLLVRGQPFGVLCLSLSTAESRLNDEQRSFVHSVGEMFVLASQSAAHRQLFERESDRLAAFEQLGSLIADSERFERALEQVLRVAARVTDSAHGSLLLLDADESRVRLRITLKEGDVLPLSVTAGPILKHGLAGWALRERRADIIDDTERDTRWLPVPGLDSMRSAMVVPLLFGERALGILTLADQSPRHYSRRSLALAAALAAHAITILARMQPDEVVEPGTMALARRLFVGRLAPDALAPLAGNVSAFARLVAPWSGEVAALSVGFRGLERLDSELAPAQLFAEVISPAMDELSAAVHDQHGYVAQRDDGVFLAVFGYPLPQSDYRLRALRAAAAIQAVARRLRGRWRNQIGCELALGIGLARGQLVAGIVGGEPAQSAVLLGAAVRDARRLQQLARPGEVIVGENLADALGEGGPGLEPLAPLALAEGEALRQVYRLVSERV